jgi:hypothetical protein
MMLLTRFASMKPTKKCSLWCRRCVSELNTGYGISDTAALKVSVVVELFRRIEAGGEYAGRSPLVVTEVVSQVTEYTYNGHSKHRFTRDGEPA